MTTVKQLKDGAKLPEPIYVSKQYVVIGKENTILMTGILDYIKHNNYGTYYDDCKVDIRRHDLYLNDNTKIAQVPFMNRPWYGMAR